MKLIISIIRMRDRQKLNDALSERGLAFTELSSTGGFLREGNATVMVCIEDERVSEVLLILGNACKVSNKFINTGGETGTTQLPFPSLLSAQPIRAETGGAVAFVIEVSEYHKF